MLRKIPQSFRKIVVKSSQAATIANMGSGMVKKNGRSLCFNKNLNEKWFASRLSYEMSTFKVNDGNFSKKDSKSTLSTSSSAIKILQSIQQLIESTQFKKKFNSYYYLQKYSWLCIHSWILLYRMRQCESMSEIISAYLLKKKLLKLLQAYTKDQVYEYDDSFDREIYEELKRRQQILFWALDQYFVFDRRDKQFAQIVEEDFGLWPDHDITDNQFQDQKVSTNQMFEGLAQKDQSDQYRWKKQEQMKQIASYFRSKISSISAIPYQKINQGDLQAWLRA